MKIELSITKYYYLLANIFLAYFVREPIILCFHRVKFGSKNLLDQRVGLITPDNFKNVIRYMSIIGYKLISLDALVGMIENSKFKKVAAITFDDGYKDLYQNAYPILRKLKIPFTLFSTTTLIDSTHLLWLHKIYISMDRLSKDGKVSMLKKHAIPGYNFENVAKTIGKIIHSKNKAENKDFATAVINEAKISHDEEARIAENLYLSKAEVMEMKNNGLSVQAHGHEHWPLTNLSRSETELEINSSIRFIENELGESPHFYALPAGTSNKFTKDIIKESGLEGIFTIQRKILTEDAINKFSLPRICVYDDMIDFYRVLFKNFAKNIYLKLFKF